MYQRVPIGHLDREPGKKIAQHRMVMERYLGRRLRDKETVHHLNGQRGDNRIENLELWTTSQKPGQRVTDLVTWAREVLQMYEREAALLEAKDGTEKSFTGHSG